jgi:Tfp pilus assembly protein PilO
MDEKLDSLTTARKNYNRVRSDLYLLEQSIPQTTQAAYFLGQIEILAQENDLQVSSIQTDNLVLEGKNRLSGFISKTSEKTPYSSLTATLSIEGSYENIKSFIKAVNNLKRAADVKTASLKSGIKRETPSGKLSVNMTIKAYYLPVEKEQ